MTEPTDRPPIGQFDKTKPFLFTPYPNGGWAIDQDTTPGTYPNQIGCYTTAIDALSALWAWLVSPEIEAPEAGSIEDVQPVAARRVWNASSFLPDVPNLLVPDGALPFTVMVDFDDDSDGFCGSMSAKIWAATPQLAVRTIQRQLFTAMVEQGADADSLQIVALCVFAGHQDPVWGGDSWSEGDEDLAVYSGESD